MDLVEIKKIIAEGENSRVEFKSEAVTNEGLAIAIIAFLNGQGGMLFWGVEDDGRITGLQGSIDRKMNTISQICQSHVRPPIIPVLDTFTLENNQILCLTVEKGIQKPYYIIKNEKILFYIRVGTTCRLASPDQIAILYSGHSFVHYDASPVPEMAVEYLDERRIQHYFKGIKKITEKQYREKRDNLCFNARISAKLADRTVATLAGGLLFGREPSRFIPSAGIRCGVFQGKKKDYEMLDKKFIDTPILPYEIEEIPVEYGIIEQAIQFVQSNTKRSSFMQGIKRIELSEYPLEVLREVITNALIHRDYSLQGGQIQLLIFSDRIEVHSPGKLPNTLTIEMIKNGASYARNPILMKFVENYGYVEHLGLGIPEKIIKPMLDRGYPEPEFTDNGYEFIVTLNKE